MRIRALTGALTAVAILVLAGCSGSADTTAGSTGQAGQPAGTSIVQADHNQADVTFAQHMIPHHGQAIQMARMATARGQSPQVKDLARRIEAAQGPEIETLTGWLEQWGAPVPPATGAGQGGMGHCPGGMMSPAQMGQLGPASGTGFDGMFLQMMIRHHEGAVTMARTEIDTGQHPAAIALAKQIIQTQQAEIREMQALLSQG
ncbi:MAG TPA: DUF305 domain-containing protein [Pseudonocardiaceae bacterium]|jgi:uncharacterized protein (DUF305 family)|nr:DUF305 domain-containing protein [Pseudonocardiaceae bacterium]